MIINLLKSFIPQRKIEKVIQNPYPGPDHNQQ